MAMNTFGSSINPDPIAAVAELRKQLSVSHEEEVIFYCSSKYNLDVLASALNEQFDCSLFGCTSSGEICNGYQTGGIVALVLPKSHFSIKPIFFKSISSIDAEQLTQVKSEINAWRSKLERDSAQNTFAISLLDGLSISEELFLGRISPLMNTTPLIGGSAGDDLGFSETKIFYDGAFWSHAALLLLVNTQYTFETFKFQHFKPSDKDMVITSADPSKRVVYEIDGAPAAAEYAKILGMPEADLRPQVFSAYPVMLQIDDGWYVRSIQKVNSDGSLTFFCAIDEGLPMTIADGTGFVETLDHQISNLVQNYEEVVVTVGFDCILRKLEMEQKGLQESVETILNKINFFGFSTYGEQFNSIHVNQTLTGVIVGKKRHG